MEKVRYPEKRWSLKICIPYKEKPQQTKNVPRKVHSKSQKIKNKEASRNISSNKDHL